MIVLMMSPSRCSTMWIVGLTIRMRPLRPLRPLRPVWRLPAPLIGSSVPSALPLSVGGFFSTPSLPPLWSPVGVGSRRSFGCAALLVLPVWAGVVAVFGGLLGGVLGGCCGLSSLCCSSSFGRGWLLFCSGRLRCLCAAFAVAVLCGWRRLFCAGLGVWAGGGVGGEGVRVPKQSASPRVLGFGSASALSDKLGSAYVGVLLQ